MKSLSFLAISLIMLTCLTWSPADARLFDTVVLKTNPFSESILSLVATHAINTEIAKMKRNMPSDAGVAQLESMFQQMVSIDGGTADIAKTYNETKDKVNQVTNIMLNKLESDYEKAKEDLTALDKAIDNSTQTISETDLEAIKMKARDWCTKKRALEMAFTNLEQTKKALAECLNAPLNLPNILVKEVAGLGEADCSKSQGTPKLGSCPPQLCTLASRIAARVDLLRIDYHRLSWQKYDNDEDKVTAMMNDSKSQGAFQDSVTSTAIHYHSICAKDDKVHDDAARMFNKNNDVRASMYFSLGTIQCYINHMKSSNTFDISPKLVKTGEDNTSSSASSCISKLKSAANIQIDIFSDASLTEDSGKVCPNVNVYEGKIFSYGNFGFHKDPTKWSPTQTKCDAMNVEPDMNNSPTFTPTLSMSAPPT